MKQKTNPKTYSQQKLNKSKMNSNNSMANKSASESTDAQISCKDEKNILKRQHLLLNCRTNGFHFFNY